MKKRLTIRCSALCIRHLQGSGGFTLLELVLATLISSLVIGIVSVSLSFSLRVWDRHQEQGLSDMPHLLELMTWQLGSFYSLPLRYDDKEQPFFIGEEHSLALATNHSIKSLSKGASIVARYVYNEEEKKLYYAEMPLDPYHPEPLEEFMRKEPKEEDSSWPVFYSVKVEEFSIKYIEDEEREEPEENTGLDAESSLPGVVLVKWNASETGTPRTHRIIRGFLSPEVSDKLL